MSDEIPADVDMRVTERGKFFTRIIGWFVGSECRCDAREVVRSQPEWNPGHTLYGYGVAVRVRVHTGVCPLADEVIAVWPVKIP